MKEYKYGLDIKKDKQIDSAISEYKKNIWRHPSCIVCDTSSNEVREDTETCEFYCDECMTITLREDISGLINTGFLK